MSGGPGEAKIVVWRRRLREFDEGSATVREFCRQAGVSKATFYQWRQRLALLSIEPKSPQVARSGKAISPLSFLPVELAAQPRSMVEVLLSNGTRVLVPSGDREALRAVIEAAASVKTQEPSC
jgi:transposase-like protein